MERLNPNKEWVIGLLAMLICILSPFASDSYVPSLPAITKALGSTANQIQLTMSLYFLGAACSQLIYGPFSDRYGRRIMLLTGLTICTLGSLLCVFSTSAIMLIAARGMQGFGAGACNGLFRAVMRDTFNGVKLAQIGSYIGVIFPVTLAAAPILGGYVESLWGWRESFLMVTLVFFSAVLIIGRYLPETNQNLDNRATHFSSMYRNYITLFTHGKFIGFTIISSLTMASFMSYCTVAPFLLQNIVGLTPVQFGWLSAFFAIAIIITQYTNGRLVMKYGIKPMLGVGIVLLIIGSMSMLSFALFHIINAKVIVIPTIICCLASGFIFSNAMAGAFEFFGHMAGIAGALYGFLQMMMSMLASLLLAHLSTTTQLPLAAIFTGIGFMTAIIFYLLHRMPEKQVET